MTTTTRRGFFTRLAGLLGAVVAAQVLPDVLPAMPERLIDPGSGVSIRFVQQYDIQTDRFPTRYDCVYSEPEFALRAELMSEESFTQHLAQATKNLADRIDRDIAEWDYYGQWLKKGEIVTLRLPDGGVKEVAVRRA